MKEEILSNWLHNLWNDNDHAIAAVAQEASSLRAALILADAFPAESRTRLQTLIRHHIDDSTSKELA